VYAATLSELSGGGLGTQISLRQQAQDVTQQVADTSSRVASDEAAIAQLRSLLKHAGSVADLLTVQEQINTEESDLEAMQTQQRALDHETAYATVTVTILGPVAVRKQAMPKPKPAPGLGNGLTAGWHAFRVTLSWLLAILGAVLPFAAALAALGALGYWGRRRLARRRPAPGG
jgi:cell division protein FtsB